MIRHRQRDTLGLKNTQTGDQTDRQITSAVTSSIYKLYKLFSIFSRLRYHVQDEVTHDRVNALDFTRNSLENFAFNIAT